MSGRRTVAVVAALAAVTAGLWGALHLLAIERTVHRPQPVSMPRDGTRDDFLSADELEQLMPPIARDTVAKARASYRRLPAPFWPGPLEDPYSRVFRSRAEYDARFARGVLYRSEHSHLAEDDSNIDILEELVPQIDVDNEALLVVQFVGSSTPAYVHGTPTLEGRRLTLRIMRTSPSTITNDMTSQLFVFAVDKSAVDLVEVLQPTFRIELQHTVLVALNYEYRGSEVFFRAAIGGDAFENTKGRRAKRFEAVAAVRDLVDRQWTHCQDTLYPKSVGRSEALNGSRSVIFSGAAEPSRLSARVEYAPASKPSRGDDGLFLRCLRELPLHDSYEPAPGLETQLRYSLGQAPVRPLVEEDGRLGRLAAEDYVLSLMRSATVDCFGANQGGSFAAEVLVTPAGRLGSLQVTGSAPAGSTREILARYEAAASCMEKSLSKELSFPEIVKEATLEVRYPRET